MTRPRVELSVVTLTCVPLGYG